MAKLKEVLQIEGEPHLQCSRCGEVKPFDEFHPNRDTSTGKSSHCKACNKEYVMSYRSKDPDKHRSEYLLRRYGVDMQFKRDLFAEQNGECAICGCHMHLTGKRDKTFTHLDHDHKTGEIRGLLCQRCNHAIGLMDDNIETLNNAINYLKDNSHG